MMATRYRKIKLTQGKWALVDTADYEWLSKWKWYAMMAPRVGVSAYYAVRQKAVGKKMQRTVWMHREIMRPPDGLEVDHIDGNGLNNRRHNLRSVTHQENGSNKPHRHPRNTSGYRGVVWHKGQEKWIAQVKLKGVHKWLGTFSSKRAAANARQAHDNSQENRNKKLHKP